MAHYGLSKSSNPLNGIASAPSLFVGRVQSIVLGPNNKDGMPNPDYKNPSDIGKITYQLLYSPVDAGSYSSKPAYPMLSFVKHYPLISEIVLLIPGPSFGMNDNKSDQTLYYLPPFSIWGHVNHNAFPNQEKLKTYLKQYYAANSSTTGSIETPKLPLGYVFQESNKPRPLRAFEGDVILESRIGQSVRFGSTNREVSQENKWSSYGPSGKPITIITNGQGERADKDIFSLITEDQDKDDALIYLTSGQKIELSDFSEFPLSCLDLTLTNNTAFNRVSVLTTPDTSKITIPANNQIPG